MLAMYFSFTSAYTDTRDPGKCVESILANDLDGDGKLDCLQLNKFGQIVVLEVWLSNNGKQIVLQKYSPSDEVISIQSLKRYRNPKFNGPRAGEAVRLTFPEKSAVLFYWNSKKLQIEEFWESE